MYITIKIMRTSNHSYSIPMHPNEKGESGGGWPSGASPFVPISTILKIDGERKGNSNN